MSILRGSAKAFTIIEMLIALGISAFVMTGLYSMLSGVLSANESLEIANNDLIRMQALQKLVSRDIRMMISPDDTEPEDMQSSDNLMDFVSYNSLNFNKSLPVNVTYYIDNDILYRTEQQAAMDYSMTLPLLRNISDASVETFDGSVYRANMLNTGYIFRFSFTVSGRILEFVTGRAVEVGSG